MTKEDYIKFLYCNYKLQNGQPIFPLSMITREGDVGDCPNCESSTICNGKLFGIFPDGPLGILGKLISTNRKKYCINIDCVYHYFEIEKDSTKLETYNQILNFIKIKERENKLKRILK